MSLRFLRDYGARRVRNYAPQPMLLDDGLMAGEDSAESQANLSYELPANDWIALNISTSDLSGWPLRPCCFVDGKDVGRTVAWLQSPEGYPAPVRLSQIGAIVLRHEHNDLVRAHYEVERVVSLIIDLFPWDEIESFALALRQHGFRLLPAVKPPDEECFDFERMRKTTQNRSMDEMTRLESRALAGLGTTPTVVDGRLEPRANAFNPASTPVVGVIKTMRENYLHPRGWQVFYNLQPGQRTPAFRLAARNLDVISWYVRLDGAHGELPNWGVVRLEVPEHFFVGELNRDWMYLDRLSRLVYEYRCQDSAYGRAAVSLHPIQRAEEKLGALFTPSDTLASHFYHLTQL
jgi:hypothetical protein